MLFYTKQCQFCTFVSVIQYVVNTACSLIQSVKTTFTLPRSEKVTAVFTVYTGPFKFRYGFAGVYT